MNRWRRAQDVCGWKLLFCNRFSSFIISIHRILTTCVSITLPGKNKGEMTKIITTYTSIFFFWSFQNKSITFKPQISFLNVSLRALNVWHNPVSPAARLFVIWWPTLRVPARSLTTTAAGHQLHYNTLTVNSDIFWTLQRCSFVRKVIFDSFISVLFTTSCSSSLKTSSAL